MVLEFKFASFVKYNSDFPVIVAQLNPGPGFISMYLKFYLITFR